MISLSDCQLMKQKKDTHTRAARATVQPTHTLTIGKHNATEDAFETNTSYDKLPPPNSLFYTTFCCMRFARLAVKGKAYR